MRQHVSNVDEIDVVVLSRDERALPAPVARGIAVQRGVRINLHRVVGTPQPSDTSRWATIARARNVGKQMGRSPWLMFLDDDIELASDTIARLVDALRRRPGHGAMAADYIGESDHGCPTAHVGMGATLFRRAVLDRIRFRCESDRCECQCCCDDMRQLGFGIAYLGAARAWHLKGFPSHHATDLPQSDAAPVRQPSRVIAPRILAAFDRRHYPKFRRIFLESLRATGNNERVTAVAYGLYPSEVHILSREPNVEVLAYPQNNKSPAVRRLQEFRVVIERWDPDTPLAYWDAADVFFQAKLDKLWEQVRDNPDKLLAVEEPKTQFMSQVVAFWTRTIRDPGARRRAFELLSARPFLNSGFAAGTPRSLVPYLEEATNMLSSFTLEGSTDWGDQTAFNLYCHTHPERWKQIEEGWNYCLYSRDPSEFHVRAGQIVSTKGKPVHAVHGTAHSFRQRELVVDMAESR